MTTIRPAGKQDLKEMLRIDKLCSPDPWKIQQFDRELMLDHSHLFVATEKEMVRGFICVWQISDELEIHSLAVDPAFRRQGIGFHLLDYALKRFWHVKAFLEVRESNTAARNLYAKLCFSEHHTRQRYYPDGENAIFMSRRLMNQK